MHDMSGSFVPFFYSSRLTLTYRTFSKNDMIVNDNVTCHLFKLATTRRPFRFFFSYKPNSV